MKRNRKSADPNLCSPARLRHRLVRLCLLERLFFPGVDSYSLPRFEYSLGRRCMIRASFADRTPDGAYGSLIFIPGSGTLLIGCDDSRGLSMDECVQIEHAARALLLKKSPALSKALGRPHPKTTGRSFAIWSPTDEGPWEDLTGKDPDCSRLARLPGWQRLLGSPMVAAKAHSGSRPYLFAGGLERRAHELAYASVLRGEPLTPETVSALNPKVTWNEAVRIAGEVGYPVAGND